MPESMTLPLLSRNDAYRAWRGVIGLLSSWLAIVVTNAPEMRIIPTPPLPEGVAMAAMVSV